MTHEKTSGQNQICQILEAARSGCPFRVPVQDLTISSWSQNEFHIPLRALTGTKSDMKAGRPSKMRWIFSTNFMLTCTN